jgi:hypothetical protein
MVRLVLTAGAVEDEEAAVDVTVVPKWAVAVEWARYEQASCEPKACFNNLNCISAPWRSRQRRSSQRQ